jgi:hypothetical protein
MKQSSCLLSKGPRRVIRMWQFTNFPQSFDFRHLLRRMSGFRNADWFGLLTFRNSLSVQSSRVKQAKGIWLPTFRDRPRVVGYRRFGTADWSNVQDSSRPRVVIYRRFGTAYWSNFQGSSRPRLVTDVSGQPIGFSWAAWPWNIGPKGCTEASLTNHQSTLPNIA